jgi:hypothetical protein
LIGIALGGTFSRGVFSFVAGGQLRDAQLQ